MVQISASLLAADYACLGAEVCRAEACGVDSFHFDLVDGHYVPNLALAPQHLTALRPYTRLPFHVHLELSNPDEVLACFAPLEAEMLIVMWDTLSNPRQTFASIRAQSKRVGLCLNPGDPLETVQPFLPELDALMLLAVQPGFGGQNLHPNTYTKITDARQSLARLGLDLPIVIDGGVRQDNAPGLIQAGADVLTIGTALFESTDMCSLITAIKVSCAE